MAIGIENLTNVTAPSSAYPKGQITDDPDGIAGTPVDVRAYGDIHQTFMRILADVGVTANILPDNNTNGYQYFNALMTLMGRDAWIDAGAPTITPIGGGTFTGATYAYNKFKQIGQTYYWSMQVRSGTITGSVTELHIQAPAPFFGSGSVWANLNGKIVIPSDVVSGGLGPNKPLGVIFAVDGGGFPILRVFDPSGAALPTGAGGFSFDINIVTEIS